VSASYARVPWPLRVEPSVRSSVRHGLDAG